MSDFKTPSNALERLARSDNSPDTLYSMEEQISSTETVLDSMSEEAKESLVNAVEKPKIPSIDDVLFNNEGESSEEKNDTTDVASVVSGNRKKAGRPRKNKEEVKTTTVSSEEESVMNDMYVPVMNQIVKDIIDDLRKKNYTISNFNDTQMKIILDYIYKKF